MQIPLLDSERRFVLSQNQRFWARRRGKLLLRRHNRADQSGLRLPDRMIDNGFVSAPREMPGVVFSSIRRTSARCEPSCEPPILFLRNPGVSNVPPPRLLQRGWVSSKRALVDQFYAAVDKSHARGTTVITLCIWRQARLEAPAALKF
jgi:hypothetical protein